MNTISDSNSIRAFVDASGFGGVDIHTTVELLRRYVFVERSLMRALAGWFIAHPRYETKYAFAHHLWHHSEHVTWLNERLVEMRGGRAEANIEPALQRALQAVVDAPSPSAFVAGAYGVIQQRLLACYRDHLACCDEAANAFEYRVLRRLIQDAEDHLDWAAKQEEHDGDNAWRAHLTDLLEKAGGMSGLLSRPAAKDTDPEIRPPTRQFDRPTTIIFDERIRTGALTAYDQRQNADTLTATREDFKVFFNEFYAATLLASVLFDADPSALPWAFFSDFAHHFWDEARHSQFGYFRLRELGMQPDTVNPVLFEQSQGMPILHRIAYLTLGLETYFMPRKRPRVKAYIERGDPRSQFFADQDWSDEANHVRYGKRWVSYLLEDDLRTEEDILAEVRKHLEQVTGKPQDAFAAPF